MFDHSCSIANDQLNKADEQINKQTTITSFSRVGFASRRKRHTKLLCCWLTRHSGDLSTSVLFCLERRQRKPMVVCYYARWDKVSKLWLILIFPNPHSNVQSTFSEEPRLKKAIETLSRSLNDYRNLPFTCAYLFKLVQIRQDLLNSEVRSWYDWIN